MSEQNLDAIVNDFKHHMPPLSEAMTKALDTLKTPQPDTKALARLVMHDTILASKTFKLVNSPYYGVRRQLTSVNKAIYSMGAMKVKNIVISLLLQKNFEAENLNALFEHSIKCATAAELLAKDFKTINSDDAFILGFLHDIGKLVLKSRYQEEYSKLIDEYGLDDNELLKIETEKFKINHAEIGARLCESWGLPAVLIDCVEFHHEPKKAKLPAATGIVYMADRLILDKPTSPMFESEVLDYINLNPVDPASLRSKALNKAEMFLKELSDF